MLNFETLKLVHPIVKNRFRKARTTAREGHSITGYTRWRAFGDDILYTATRATRGVVVKMVVGAKYKIRTAVRPPTQLDLGDLGKGETNQPFSPPPICAHVLGIDFFALAAAAAAAAAGKEKMPARALKIVP